MFSFSLPKFPKAARLTFPRLIVYPTPSPYPRLSTPTVVSIFQRRECINHDVFSHSRLIPSSTQNGNRLFLSPPSLGPNTFSPLLTFSAIITAALPLFFTRSNASSLLEAFLPKLLSPFLRVYTPYVVDIGFLLSPHFPR